VLADGAVEVAGVVGLGFGGEPLEIRAGEVLLGEPVEAVADLALVAQLVQAWPGITGWRVVFLLTFAMCVSFTAVWFRFIKAEIVPALNTPAVAVGEIAK
jgi:hypothetical protein